MLVKMQPQDGCPFMLVIVERVMREGLSLPCALALGLGLAGK